MNTKNHKVIVYSTPTCPYCVYAKDYFKQNSVAFEDVDVSRDRARAHEMVAKSGQMGVPVIDIDGTILVGFQPQAFASLLA
jgi:glutaredoxin 3